MTLAFPMRFHPAEEGGYWVQGLAPLTNVLTEGETIEDAKAMAREALSAVLASMLDHGEPIPRPSTAEGEGIQLIAPEPSVVMPILLRWAREDAKLTLAELASRMGMTYQAVQKLERSTANPTIKTLTKLARALGRELDIAI